MDDTAQDRGEAPVTGVAIIGMVGRFPGAPDLDALWRNVRDGVESITFFSDEQLQAAGVDAQTLKSPSYVKARGVIDRVDLFDANFFGYSHRDALLMDPQQRLFLQGAWEALETAGYDPKSYRGLIGVYGGATASSYHALLFNNFAALGGDGLAMAIGNELPFLTTRVSYKLDLKGPSCPVQTACSTSLVAVHLACQGLLNAECDMALAGGVSLRVPQEAGYHFQDEGILSPDGHCRSFDASAAGTIFSNGLGIVVLKRLEDALADGDTVYAVIRGSAINNDGARRASFTAPGVGGQSQVIADALASAEVDPETIGYVEAHGTATALGDSIEVQALTKAFGTTRRNYCALGTIKANIGHLDAAAGVAGLIKTVLSLQHEQLPPTAHFERPNPDIRFESTPFYVNGTLREWPRNGTPRRAGVSSFGFGGTNAHVVIEEAPELPPTADPRPVQLLVVSAETPTALEQASSNLAAYLASHTVDLADAAYTLKVGRRAFRQRRAIVCRTRDEAVKALDARDPKAVFTGSAEGPDRRVTFLFPGQGAQYVSMGAELYRHEPVFRETVDRCAEQLTADLGFDLREVLYPAGGVTEELSRRLTRTSVAQPALFVVEYALAQLLMASGVKPDACIGHSLGEFVAACLAGVLSEADALRLVALRGRLMDSMPEGVMLAVPLPEARVRRLLDGELWMAAVNHASLCVVSGMAASIAAFEARLLEEGVECQRLQTSHAFHSGLMDAAVAPFVEAVRGVALNAPAIPYISNVTGTWITETEARDPEYWGRQIREAVRFADGVSELLKQDGRVFLEVGPGNTLGTLVRRQAAGKAAQAVFSTLRHPREDASDLVTFNSALGRLWTSGVPVDWRASYEDEPRRRVALPPYPFEGQRYWIEAAPASAARSAAAPRPEGRIADVSQWFYAPAWKRAALAVPAAASAPARRDTWLVLLDDHGIGTRLVDRLNRSGHDVIVASAGDRFARVASGRYTVDPTSRGDYQMLLKELSGANRVPAVVLHLFGLGPVGDADRSARDYERDHQRGFGTLMALSQALGDSDITSPVRVTVVTNNSLEVTGHETIAPGKITALGVGRVIPQEYPTLSCRYLDLDWVGAGVADLTDTALDRLLLDAAAPGTEAVVAYRASHRWVQTYDALPLGAPAGVPARLRANGVYLITGGLGDIGLHMAKYLLTTVNASVVLTGRSGLPPREQWDEYLQRNSQHDPMAQRIARVKELEPLGGGVLVLKADAGNRGEMEAVFAAAEARFGPLNGVIHAAGLITGDAFRPIADADASACGRQFQPKIVGLCVLDELVASRPLDFCLLVSSLSSILGGLQYAAYASANLFMDAFAYRRNRTSAFPWLTVNWDSWMRGEDEARLQASGTQPAGFVMTPTEGIGALGRLLDADWGVQAIVSTGDLQGRLDQWVNMDALGAGAGHDSGDVAARHPRPNLQTEYVAPGTDLEKAIAAIWEELLGVDRVGLNDNFFELGGDSFLGIQVISRLKKQLGVKVSAVTLYEGPRVGLLAGIIAASAADRGPAFEVSRTRGERRRERKKALETPTPMGT